MLVEVMERLPLFIGKVVEMFEGMNDMICFRKGEARNETKCETCGGRVVVLGLGLPLHSICFLYIIKKEGLRGLNQSYAGFFLNHFGKFFTFHMASGFFICEIFPSKLTYKHVTL